jgi:hypothetical protein
MPSATIPGGHLALATENGTWPWNFFSWQTLTGINVPPWSDQKVTNWTTDITNQVLTFVRNFWSKSESEQHQYMQNKRDNDWNGRDTWRKWVTENWDKKWKMNGKIDEVPEREGFGYYQLMKEAQRQTVRDSGC